MVLASPPMAYVGRISYGTYLWHWPLIVGAFYYGVHLTDLVRSVLVLVSLALGALSYHLVEMPVRRMPVTEGKRRLYLLFAGQCALMLGVAVWLLGQPGKAVEGEDARLEALKAQVMNVHDRWDACWSKTTPDTFCRVGAEGAQPAFAVWGDSMANSAVPAFDAYGDARGQAGVMITKPGCAPLAGAGPDPSCIAFNDAILDYLDTAPPMDVILMARWSYYAEGYGNRGDRPGETPLLRPGGRAAAENFPLFRTALDEAIARIGQRHRVVVVNQFPVFPRSVPKAMLREMRFGTESMTVTRQAFEARNGRAVRTVRKLWPQRTGRCTSPRTEPCAGRIAASMPRGACRSSWTACIWLRGEMPCWRVCCRTP